MNIINDCQGENYPPNEVEISNFVSIGEDRYMLWTPIQPV